MKIIGAFYLALANSKLYFLLQETSFAAKNGLPHRGNLSPKSIAF